MNRGCVSNVSDVAVSFGLARVGQTSDTVAANLGIGVTSVLPQPWRGGTGDRRAGPDWRSNSSQASNANGPSASAVVVAIIGL
jgi:hypothetical protein